MQFIFINICYCSHSSLEPYFKFQSEHNNTLIINESQMHVQKQRDKAVTRMDLYNLEVKIRNMESVSAPTKGVKVLFFVLRLGSIISQGVEVEINSQGGGLKGQIELVLTCDENTINNNVRACLSVCEGHSSGEKKTSGVIYIMLQNTQNEYHKYRIPECSDQQASIELKFAINPVEIRSHRGENSSQASKSSLAQIKQFCKVLSKAPRDTDPHKPSKDRKHSRRDASQIFKAENQAPRSSKQTENNLKHIRSEESPWYEDESGDGLENGMNLIVLQEQLSKQMRKNSVLRDLLALEQHKFEEAISVIKKLIQSKNPSQSQHQHIPQQLATMLVLNANSKLGENPQAKTIRRSNEIVQNPTYQKQQMHSLSQQLLEECQIYKNQNEQLLRTNDNLKREIDRLKAEMLEGGPPRKCSEFIKESQVAILVSEKEEMLQKYREMERKFKESLKAIGDFKNDALEAREQIIIKDQQINKLKARFEDRPGLSTNEHSFSTDQNHGKQTIFDTMKNIAIESHDNKKQYLRILSTYQQNLIQQEEEVPNNRLAYQVIEKVKEAFDRLFHSYRRQDKHVLSIIEMRKDVMMVVNSYKLP